MQPQQPRCFCAQLSAHRDDIVGVASVQQQTVDGAVFTGACSCAAFAKQQHGLTF